MSVYEQINALPTVGIGTKSAHLIAGGIGGLSAAAFLVDDAHMPANRSKVYALLGVVDTP